MKVKQCLNNVVVFDFLALFFSLLWKAIIASEVEMRNSDLVITILTKDGHVIVEDLNPEVLWFVLGLFCNLLTILHQLDVKTSRGVVDR